jgi:hypothetical protein
MGEVTRLVLRNPCFRRTGVDGAGAVVIRKRISRAKVLEFFGGLSPCLVGIEACPSAHHWSRELKALGHTGRLTDLPTPADRVRQHRSLTHQQLPGSGAASRQCGPQCGLSLLMALEDSMLDAQNRKIRITGDRQKWRRLTAVCGFSTPAWRVTLRRWDREQFVERAFRHARPSPCPSIR